ncbi:hypothetical protein F4X33_06470 [Candidatus Poribacteria bacterium]|nr:hypothetical protein [Candidatus Poribacteria bacterium]
MNRQQLYCIIVCWGLILTAIPSHAQQQESQEQQIELLIQQLGVQATQEEAIDGLVELGPSAVPALLKALHSKDPQVQDRVILMFMGSHDYLDDASAVADAMLEILDYEHPHRNSNAIYAFLRIGDRLQLAITLRSPKWSVRFGVAEAYVYAWNDAYQPTSKYCAGPLPPEVIPNLIAGLNKGLERGDASLCETAVRALKQLDLAEYHARQTLDNIHKAKKALKAFPPPVILESSVKDGDNAVDSTALNQEGIYFRLNNYIYDATESIIRLDVPPQYTPLARGVPFSRLKGKILEWEIQQESSYELKMVPRSGNELVGNAVYQIELSVIDLYGNQLTQQIQFITAKTKN